MPVRVSTAPRVTAAPTITWVGDGTIKLVDGGVLSQDDVAAIKQILSDQKQVLILNGGGDADTLFNNGMHSLNAAYLAGDPTAVPPSMRMVVRGVHLKFNISTGPMVAGATHVAKVPTTAGLVEAGQTACKLMKDFPGETFNARAQVDPALVAGQCQGLDLHVKLKDVYDTASEKVQPGCVFLSDQVCTAAAITYTAIQEALPINEDLKTEAEALLGYFDEPIEQGQKTKKLVQKTKDQTTQEVTSSVQAKALDQARTEVKGELAGKVGSFVESVIGGSTTAK